MQEITDKVSDRVYTLTIILGIPINNVPRTYKIDAYSSMSNTGQRTFHVELDTKLGFAEALEFLRKTLGLPANSPVLSLTYGGKNRVHFTNSILRDDSELYPLSQYYKRREVMDKASGEQQIVLRGPKGTDWEGAGLMYFKGKTKLSGVESLEDLRQLTYQDSRIVQPRLNQFLTASPMRLNEQEKLMLEEMIQRALLVDK